MTSYDVIVIGAGHNGLVCAIKLAQAGLKVHVVEANETAGGAANNREFAPGFTTPGCAQWLTQMSPELSRELKLEQHGLEFVGSNLPTVALAADGNALIIDGESVSGANVSAKDQQALKDFRRLTGKFNRLLYKAFSHRPPRLIEADFADRWQLLQLGLRMRLMGKDDMNELLRLGLNNIYDLLNEWFEHPGLRGALSLDAVLGTHLGPRSPNTVFTYLQRRLAEAWGEGGVYQVKGGLGSFGDALAAAANAAGVSIQYGNAVSQITMTQDRVSGVTLSDGQSLTSRYVVSNADPVTTFSTLLGYQNVETDTARRVSQIRCKSGASKLHLALDGLPEFTGLSLEDLGHRLVVAPDMDYVERAFNSVKYDEYSPRPMMDISIPTVRDPELAPAGKHVLSAIVQHAPFSLEGGWAAHRDQVISDWVECIAQYAPGLREQIISAELLTPEDLQDQYHMTGGHWDHGEISFDQVLMMRPFPAAAQYETPVAGLFLCGAGSHPGGGLMGLAGSNAARQVNETEKNG
ncbi:MAG: NAD(P)/FAD-dependent oxidoreductase [Halioglobus sp.]